MIGVCPNVVWRFSSHFVAAALQLHFYDAPAPCGWFIHLFQLMPILSLMQHEWCVPAHHHSCIRPSFIRLTSTLQSGSSSCVLLVRAVATAASAGLIDASMKMHQAFLLLR